MYEQHMKLEKRCLHHWRPYISKANGCHFCSQTWRHVHLKMNESLSSCTKWVHWSLKWMNNPHFIRLLWHWLIRFCYQLTLSTTHLASVLFQPHIPTISYFLPKNVFLACFYSLFNILHSFCIMQSCAIKATDKPLYRTFHWKSR